jgi:hypothetical protein
MTTAAIPLRKLGKVYAPGQHRVGLQLGIAILVAALLAMVVDVAGVAADVGNLGRQLLQSAPGTTIDMALRR